MLRGFTRPYAICILGTSVSRQIISPVLKWEKYISFIYHAIKLPIQVTTGKSIDHRPMDHLNDSSNFTSIKSIRHPTNLLLWGTWCVDGTAGKALFLATFMLSCSWSGLSFPSPGNLFSTGIELTSPASPALTGRFFTPEPPILKDDAVKVLHSENSAVPTGMEKVSFYSNPKENHCQRMLKLSHSFTHLTC